ncbi:MAG TPA: PIG-L family deacetylase, partial [Mycobacteriales bacterium]|nr:PIG-L family deacetylase [Mycobacteriales bacterium]
MTATIEGLGTDEAIWKPWLTVDRWTELDLSAALDRRTVVVAAHPDDEVLGAGGLMMKLARMGCPMVVVWATDGEASHP